MYNGRRKIVLFSIRIIYIWTFVEMFCVIPTTSEKFKNTIGTIIPYVSVPLNIKYLIMIIMSIILFLLAIIYRNGKVIWDKIIVFMVLRIALAVFQIFFFTVIKGESVSTGNYLIWIVEFLLYFSVLQYNEKEIRTQLEIYAKFISLVIAVQVYIQGMFRILPSVSYSSTYYKACMIIPVGESNFLSVLIIPGLVAMLFQEKKKIRDNFFILICSGAIVLTKSRYAILILLVSFIYWTFMVTENTKRSNLKKWLVVLIACGIAIVVLLDNRTEIISILYGYSDFVTTGGFLNKITSGRVGAFGGYFDKIIQHPLMGNGPNYLDSRAHNIVIDLLYQTGILFTVLFFDFFVETFRKARRELAKYDFFKIVILIMLIHSFGEISFFTSVIADILFFSCLAYFSNESRKCIK